MNFEVKEGEQLEEKRQHEIQFLSPEELEAQNEAFHFPEKCIEECRDKRQLPRLEVGERMSFGVLNILEEGKTAYAIRELNFFITKESLILVSRYKIKLVEELLGNGLDLSPSRALVWLLEKMIARNQEVLNEIEKRIQSLEERVMTDMKTDFTKLIMKNKRELLFLKSYLEPLEDIIDDLADDDYGILDEAAGRGMDNVRRKMHRLSDNLAHLRDFISQVREAYQSQIDIKLNRTMQFFTVIATIFLPLTLITSWYGMNFQGMPELHWRFGYPMVITICIAVFVISVVYLTKKKYF